MQEKFKKAAKALGMATVVAGVIGVAENKDYFKEQFYGHPVRSTVFEPISNKHSHKSDSRLKHPVSRKVMAEILTIMAKHRPPHVVTGEAAIDYGIERRSIPRE